MMKQQLTESSTQACSQYRVIGNPIKQSKSPIIHRLFAEQTSRHIDYQALLLAEDGFAQGVRTLIEQGGRGANVTMPFKLDAYAMATQLSDRAKAAGAVNTLTFDGKDIVGDNTDGAGLVHDIEHNAAFSLAGKRVLLLGAGGAARGVIMPLMSAQVASLVIANRTVEKAQTLVAMAQTFSHGEVQLVACSFEDIQGQFDVVINATSASMSNAVPPIPTSVFAAESLAYDMMYSDSITPFLQFAQPFVSYIRDGLGMLVEQAAESFFVWHGVRPDTAIVLDHLRHLQNLPQLQSEAIK